MAKIAGNTFKTAVEATADVSNGHRPGLRALGAYSSKITLTNGSLCEGSVDIDSCTTAKYPNANRWDYCIGYNSSVYFVEVHSANTGGVTEVVKKLQWLKDWLNSEAPELTKIKAGQPFHWIRSGKYDILPNSPQARLAARHNIAPIGKLILQ